MVGIIMVNMTLLGAMTLLYTMTVDCSISNSFIFRTISQISQQISVIDR